MAVSLVAGVVWWGQGEEPGKTVAGGTAEAARPGSLPGSGAALVSGSSPVSGAQLEGGAAPGSGTPSNGGAQAGSGAAQGAGASPGAGARTDARGASQQRPPGAGEQGAPVQRPLGTDPHGVARRPEGTGAGARQPEGADPRGTARPPAGADPREAAPRHPAGSDPRGAAPRPAAADPRGAAPRPAPRHPDGTGPRGSARPPDRSNPRDAARPPAGTDPRGGTSRRPAAQAPRTPEAKAAPRPRPVARPLPRSRATRLSIGYLDIDAPVMDLRLDRQHRLPAPPDDDPNLVGWYADGPTPGEHGTAVAVGHLDTDTGPAVFSGLTELRRGRTVEIRRADGRTAVYVVDAVKSYEKDRFPSVEVYAARARPELRLITCGGNYDRRTGYSGNVVVFAHLVKVREAPAAPARR
ncbi:class F sortase [Streptomyces sp. NPDC057806]|uniref:class F sortase n=1 Tax=Streptomyces sp. NPDC057806 TaxID=3346255 RepID=UPI003693DF1A